MKAAMSVLHDPDPALSLDDRLIAFDNFEQLIESLDNANNMHNLGLWKPLLDLLAHEEAEMRHMAAWCVGTAVQNNAPSQEKLLAHEGIPKLVDMALKPDERSDVRRKAVYALSSACRNYQPAMDVCTEHLAKSGKGPSEKVDAMNMDAVDAVMEPLKKEASQASA